VDLTEPGTIITGNRTKTAETAPTASEPADTSDTPVEADAATDTE